MIEENNNDEYLFMASQALNSYELNAWLIDSGCTGHETEISVIFTSTDRSFQPKVKLGNGEVESKRKGDNFCKTRSYENCH